MKLPIFSEDSIVHTLNQILSFAIEHRASDIHFEPYEYIYRIRIRQDGLLREIAQPPLSQTNYLLARLKILANLDITERRLPQDGRFKFSYQGRCVDCRLSTCPTLFGEKATVRLLQTHHSLLSLSDLGMTESQLQQFNSALHAHHGMILVCGPTGSGKTLTLYTALAELNKPEVNIVTVEDPIEIPLEGINQMAVSVKTQFTFATALRTLMRQDPDVIMVGEIRDGETAEIATKAAQTGHLVLSTLHTHNTFESLLRLTHLGVALHYLQESLSLIVSQTLIRRLCVYCKKPHLCLPEELLSQGFSNEDLTDLQLFVPVGCEQCYQGFKGRIGVFELMPISENLKAQMTPKNLFNLRKSAHVTSLRQHALEKAKLGLTSLDEVNRV